MLQRLMVPLDTSPFAEQALPYALRIARQTKAELNLVCVSPTAPVERSVPFTEQEYLDRLAANLQADLAGQVTATVLHEEVQPLLILPPASNTVADLLDRHARAHQVDLIVMATHGRGGIRRAWLGSVADSLIRTTSLPVMLVRPEDDVFSSAAKADRGLHHIVVPLDGSEAAHQVIPFALALGAPFGARYSLVHVMSPLARTTNEVPVQPPALVTSKAARAYLEQRAQLLESQGAYVTTQLLESFTPATAIDDYAKAHGADAIALSTHGAGGVRRWLLGSVADKLVRGSDVPVLVCNFRNLGEERADGETALVAASRGTMLITA